MFEQLKAFSIMAIVLCAIAIYSLFVQDMTFAGIPLEKARIAESTPKPSALTARAGHRAPQTKTKGDSLTILFFGDSMLEGLMHRFYDYAKANGHSLRTVLWYSSNTERWATTTTLDYYLQRFKPSFVVVCLGSNELFVRDLSKRDGYIQTIVETIGHVPFVWISPPNWKRDTGINQLILNRVGKERFFDSRRLTLERKQDGAHPTMEAAAVWFDHVAQWLRSDSTAFPIRLDTPAKHYPLSGVITLAPDFKGK